MSPLLTARPTISVTLRLVGACVVTVAIAVGVSWTGANGQSTAAAPTGIAIGAVCAALLGYLLSASARPTSDGRLIWLSIGVALALVGLATSLLGERALFPGGGPVDQSPSAGAARYVIWHVALIASGVLALSGLAPRPRNLLIFGGLGVFLLVWAAVASYPLGHLVTLDGYSPALRTINALIVVAQLLVAVAWYRRSGGSPSWSEMCVLALMILSALDAFAYTFATQPFSNAWWTSLTLRAGQFVVPAVGLLIGFVAVAEKLREFEDELAANLVAERERAREQEELTSLDDRRRAQIRERILALTNGEGLAVAFQPIVDLASGRVVGAEALARFADADGNPLPTERSFLDAHAVDLGVELELAVIQLALACESRLPSGRYLALNVSAALLERQELLDAIAARTSHRPIVVEITEHQPVEDYPALTASLARLRGHGIRVAVDDVGSGFASFRHVTHVNPDILKLDRTLVCGIDDDPVRQSLASAIVAFGRDIGATIVSEGIETDSELCCLKDLAVGCGQGFYLARPNLGPIEAEVPQLTALA